MTSLLTMPKTKSDPKFEITRSHVPSHFVITLNWTQKSVCDVNCACLSFAWRVTELGECLRDNSTIVKPAPVQGSCFSLTALYSFTCKLSDGTSRGLLRWAPSTSHDSVSSPSGCTIRGTSRISNSPSCCCWFFYADIL